VIGGESTQWKFPIGIPFEHLLSQLDTQARSRGQRNIAIVDLERRGCDLLAACLKIDEVFGNEKVGHHRCGLERGCQANGGAVVVVRRDGNIIGLSHRGNFFQFEYAAAVAHIRIDDVRCLFFKDGAKF
jgi:hypothetical protein